MDAPILLLDSGELSRLRQHRRERPVNLKLASGGRYPFGAEQGSFDPFQGAIWSQRQHDVPTRHETFRHILFPCACLRRMSRILPLMQ